MIETIYRCDLCRSGATKLGAGYRDSKRVYFELSDKIKLVPLTDSTHTSHTVICGRCLHWLSVALNEGESCQS